MWQCQREVVVLVGRCVGWWCLWSRGWRGIANITIGADTGENGCKAGSVAGGWDVLVGCVHRAVLLLRAFNAMLWTSARNVSHVYGLPQQAGKAIVPSKNFGKIRGYCNLQYMYIIAQSGREEQGKNRAEVVVSEAAWDRVLLQVPIPVFLHHSPHRLCYDGVAYGHGSCAPGREDSGRTVSHAIGFLRKYPYGLFSCGGGCRHTCMDDGVVKCQDLDIAAIIFSLIWRRNIAQTSWRNRKKRFELPTPSEAHWSITKSGGMRLFFLALCGMSSPVFS